LSGDFPNGRRDLATTQDVDQFLVLSTGRRIVRLSVVVLVEVALEPLTELKVVLVLRLRQLCDIYVLLDSILVERILEHFVVVHKFIIVLSGPLDLVEVEALWIDRVHDLAVYSGSGTLLDLGEVQLKEFVHP